jgi:outer membrane murein-binding lipoprotein Lpp
MQKFRPLLVCLLCVSLFLTNLAFTFHGNTKNENEVIDSVVQREINFIFSSPLGFPNGLQTRIPPFVVWTSMSLRDVQACLPSGATAQANRDGGYLISGLTDYISFGVHLGVQTGRVRADFPRFSREGGRDPGPPDARIKAQLLAMAHIIVNLIYRPQWRAGGGRNFPPGPIPSPDDVRKLLPNGWNQNGPVPQPDGDGGDWTEACSPTTPCVRPQEPTPETAPDCKAELDKIDELLDKIKAVEASIEEGKNLLSWLQKIKAGADILDDIMAALTLIAGLTAPIALTPGTATMAIAGGAAGITAGLAIVAAPLAIYLLKKLFDITILNPLINYVKSQLAELNAALDNLNADLQKALKDLQDCKTKAAEVKQKNTEAFQKFISVDLPAYYKCLKQRKCKRTWKPK